MTDQTSTLMGTVPTVPSSTVFFASDPAGTRACLALASLLRERSPDATPRVFGNRGYDFEREFPVALVRLSRQPEAGDLTGAPLLFCGTSHPASSQRFELAAIAVAARSGITSAAFVDHWTNFRLRFESETGALVLPDQIWVMDAHAAALAQAEGLPRDRLRVTGSPTLTFLSRAWRSPRTSAEIRVACGLAATDLGPVLLYAPDPISLRSATAGGFDEISAARHLAAAVKMARPDATVALRLHPLQPQEQLPAIAGAFADRGVRSVFPPPALSGPELCSIADVVIGFYSNFLLEARALGCSVIRYLPGQPEADPLHHLVFGQKVTDPAGLAAALTTSLRSDGDAP